MSEPDFKRLIRGEDTYTVEANELFVEVREAIKPIIQKYIDAGYSTFDIEHCISAEVYISVCAARFKRKRNKLDKA